MPRGGMWPAERTKSSVEVGGDLNVAALEKARSDDRNRELGFTSLHPNSFASSPVTFEGSGLSCIFREIFQKFRVRKLVNYFASQEFRVARGIVLHFYEENFCALRAQFFNEKK